MKVTVKIIGRERAVLEVSPRQLEGDDELHAEFNDAVEGAVITAEDSAGVAYRVVGVHLFSEVSNSFGSITRRHGFRLAKA